MKALDDEFVFSDLLVVTDFNLLVYLINTFLILLQTVRHDRHQVEVNLLRTVSVQIFISTSLQCH